METLDPEINLLEELDSISRIHWLDRDDIDHIMIDIAKRIVLTLKIERVSIWLLNMEKDAIVSMGEYDLRTKEFRKENVLKKKDFPNYFEALEKNKIILVEDIHSNSITKELDEVYSIPFGVESLMDIPVRIAGTLIGVMCFEKTGKRKKFTGEEQSFALSVGTVLASNLEARHRRAAQHKLEMALVEKDLLIAEINHRVKNNFSILISLLRISKEFGKTTDPEIIFEEYEQRMMSMLKIHDLLNETQNYTSINLSDYLNELVNEFRKSHPALSSSIIASVEKLNFLFSTKNAVHLGLIVSEIFLNSVKYALPGNGKYQLSIDLHQKGNLILLKIGDNGPGFDFVEKLKMNTLGLPIIRDLAEGMEIKMKFPGSENDGYEFEIEALHSLKLYSENQPN
jgi:two-component sensor histidine kinase